MHIFQSFQCSSQNSSNFNKSIQILHHSSLSWHLHFHGFLLSKSYKVSAKKLQKSYLSWHCGFKYDMRNLVNFHPTTQKSQNFFSMGSFCPKYLRFDLQKYKGVIFHGTGQWCKIWINPDLVASKMVWGTWWFLIRALKSLKSCIFLFKAYNVSARKFHRSYVSWHW